MTTPSIYQLRIELDGCEPAIERTVEVPAWFDFSQLHNLLQAAMDWQDDHLHNFEVFRKKPTRKQPFGIQISPEFAPDGTPLEPVPFHEVPGFSSTQVRLSDIPWSKSLFIVYTYDFGDNWQLLITRLKEKPPEPQIRYPTIISGQNASPPQDVGGISSYLSLLQSWYDRSSPDYYDAREILGNRFQPEAFDLAKTNKKLVKLQKLTPPTGLRLKPEITFPK